MNEVSNRFVFISLTAALRQMNQKILSPLMSRDKWFCRRVFSLAVDENMKTTRSNCPVKLCNSLIFLLLKRRDAFYLVTMSLCVPFCNYLGKFFFSILYITFCSYSLSVVNLLLTMYIGDRHHHHHISDVIDFVENSPPLLQHNVSNAHPCGKGIDCCD